MYEKNSEKNERVKIIFGVGRMRRKREIEFFKNQSGNCSLKFLRRKGLTTESIIIYSQLVY